MPRPPSRRPDRVRLRELLDRLARLIASDRSGDDLNPVQRAALVYLSRANRFSRSPSQVADYLLATRGTVSQTLRSLSRKGLVIERRSETDRRSIAYELTGEGASLVRGADAVDAAVDALDGAAAAALSGAVESLLRDALAARGGRSFGVCRTCRHHRPGEGRGGARCALLEVELSADEAERICHEHAWGDAA